LHFLGLETPELAVARVAERVKNGGHDVSKSTIYERFEAGLKILDNEAVHHYHNIAVYDSSEEFHLQITINKEEVTYVSNSLNRNIFQHLPKLSSLIN
jgi:predicted ABC-type ATPase